MNTNDLVYILGGGYIGIAIYNHLSPTHNVKLIASSTVNYHNPKEFWRLLVDKTPKIVINCSGFTGKPNVDQGEIQKSECWRLNVTSPVNIVDSCNKLGIKCVHISSGCIYDGYDKVFSEEDAPNFGLFDNSSFYSKSKHAFELATINKNVTILRLRMPICDDINNERNYLWKLKIYPNLINFTNSKTYIPDLCGFIETYLSLDTPTIGQTIYNVVNSNPLNTREVISILNTNIYDYKYNPNWIELKDLKTLAPRSNCMLSNDKASTIYKFKTEREAIQTIISNI